MPATHIGNDGASLVLMPGYPQKERRGAIWSLVYLYWCAKSSAESLAPAAGSVPPGGVHPELECFEVRIYKHEAPNLAYVEVRYANPEYVAFPRDPEAGDVILESEASFFEQPVDGGNGSMSQADIDEAVAKNARTIPMATVTFHRTEYRDSFTWDEANIVAGTGNVSDPVGMVNPTAGNWMKVGRSVRSGNSDLIEVRDSWQYNSLGWDNLFPNAFDGAATTTTTTT